MCPLNRVDSQIVRSGNAAIRLGRSDRECRAIALRNPITISTCGCARRLNIGNAACSTCDTCGSVITNSERAGRRNPNIACDRGNLNAKASRNRRRSSTERALRSNSAQARQSESRALGIHNRVIAVR